MHVYVCMIVAKRKLMLCNHSVIVPMIPLHDIFGVLQSVLQVHITYEYRFTLHITHYVVSYS